jgi:hypothetical protein
MAKEKMVCPFTKKMCVNCSIYRGRHYYMCFSKCYQGCLLESGEIEQLKNESRTSEDVVFGFPDDIVKSSKCIKNIEDIVMKLDMQVSSV